MSHESISWPPSYVIKKHPRAKYVKLKASAKLGLELVVPVRFNQREIPFILEKNKQWIQKQLNKLQQVKSSECFPTEIALRALGQTWAVHFIKSNHPKSQLMVRPQLNELVLLGEKQDIACYALLTRWVKLQAKEHLLPELKRLSVLCQLPFDKASIRDQKTRWGSCTSGKVISLNYRLLFFPQPLAHHIMIHELCHTVHLNHSEKFWQLVEKFDPEWKKNRLAIRHIHTFMPSWMI